MIQKGWCSLKILIVSKDLGGGAVAAPLARLALERGDEVVVITEGLAPREFGKHGISLYFQGTANFQEVPFSLDIWAALRQIKPNLVVITLGSPNNLENTFALAANESGLPLVFIEDCHGAHVRTSAVPDLVVTLDNYASQLVLARYPATQVVLAGHPGVPAPAEVELIRDKHLGSLKALGARIYAFVGGDPSATEKQLQLLIRCLEQTRGDWRLIPRFHPKWAKVADPKLGRLYGDIWMGMLAPLGERVLADSVDDERHLVASADVSLADFSTLLTTAVCCGKTAVFLETPAVLESLVATTGLATMPLVELGCAHRVSEPTDLSTLTPPTPNQISSLQPYDPARAHDSLRSLLA